MFVFFGALIGVLGFLPLIAGLKASKKVTKTSNFGYGAILLLGVFGSLIILCAGILICYFCFRDNIVEFAFAAAITLILFAIVYGIYTSVKRNKAAKERKESLEKDKKEGKEK